MKPTLRTVVLFALIPTLVLLTIVQAIRVHDSIYAVILEGFDRKLLAVGQAISARIDGDVHAHHQSVLRFDGSEPPATNPMGKEDAAQSTEALEESILDAGDFTGLFNPEHPYFVSHRNAFQLLREELGLTFLYTQVLMGGDRIVYMLDGTAGEDWVPPGSVDQLPADSLDGISKVQVMGIPWVTGLLDWDNWGLLKSSYTPVRNSRGKVVAMVGADVDISIVRTKTRQAFFSVLLFGVLMIAVSLLMSLQIYRSLTRPIDKLRDVALGIAAGNTTDHVVRSRLREVDILAVTLDRLSQSLAEQQRQAQCYHHQLESVRRPSEMLEEASKDQSEAEDVWDETALADSGVDRALFLNTTTPWNRLPASELLILAQSCRERTYLPGKTICPSGHVPEYFYIVRSGKGTTPEGRPMPSILGVSSILSGNPLETAMVASPSGCSVLALPRGKLLGLLHYRPELKESLLELEDLLS
jgi:HAMP domain-containing protein